MLRGKTSPENELWKGPASFLFRTLVQPFIARGFLKEGDHLIISPHARLHEVPFACLMDSGGRLLVERYTVSYVPTASSILLQRGTTEPTTFLAFVPDTKSLPFAEQEVAGVPSRLFASYKAQRNDEASASELIQRAQGFDVIHIAAHGSMHRWDPLFSHLRLSDGPFELYKILDLKLSARLVVLSACETGYGVGMMGDIAQGHEVVSFPQAFLSAGASAVIAPLWVVEDEATSHLMAYFYSHLALMKQPDHSLPPGSFARSLAIAQSRFAREAEQRRGKSHP
ncbi:MAG: CHAT domain-containing protein, partial [Bacteroidota bacterium]